MGLTVVMTVETPGDPGGTLSRYGVEEFVADNVVLLRNVREGSYRRRTLEVLKMRGAMHHKGDVGFTVVPGQGLVVLPVTAPQQEPQQGSERVSSGNAGLDRLTHGGLLRGSSTLLSGPTGTGKTLLATQFAAEGAATGERALVVAYEETPEQVRANGRALGHDLATYEQQGLLDVVSLYPEVASLDDHLVEIRSLVERLQPTRLVIDSLSALERIGSAYAYREFVISITSFIKTRGLASVMTASSAQLDRRDVGDREPHLRPHRHHRAAAARRARQRAQARHPRAEDAREQPRPPDPRAGRPRRRPRRRRALRRAGRGADRPPGRAQLTLAVPLVRCESGGHELPCRHRRRLRPRR